MCLSLMYMHLYIVILIMYWYMQIVRIPETTCSKALLLHSGVLLVSSPDLPSSRPQTLLHLVPRRRFWEQD